jgi:hypothetical protein
MILRGADYDLGRLVLEPSNQASFENRMWLRGENDNRDIIRREYWIWINRGWSVLGSIAFIDIVIDQSPNPKGGEPWISNIC